MSVRNIREAEGLLMDVHDPSKGPVLPKDGQRNVLITSALPYVNNVPHLGNIIGSTLSADVFARYNRTLNVPTLYICGTDEYGTATETKALEEGVTPYELCTKFHKLHTEIYEWFQISFDKWGRTSSPKHTEITQGIYKRLHENGLFRLETTDQTYCEDDKLFLADRFVEGICPNCGYDDARGDQCDKCSLTFSSPTQLLNPRCKRNKAHTLSVRPSTHACYRLDLLQPRLVEWMQNARVKGKWGTNAVITEKGEIVEPRMLGEGLRPSAVTRDLKWGVEVPKVGDEEEDKAMEGKVIYVWFDAPIGYPSITAAYTEEWEKWWKNPDNVELYQFMGKDNVYFHTVLFPAMLLGTEERWTMLHNISSTQYLNYEDTKFSKSRNVGVFGNNARETGQPPEIWRYYLISQRPENSDSSFLWSKFIAANNNELLANLGNFVNRVVKFINAKLDSKVPGPEGFAGGEVAPLADSLDVDFVTDVNTRLKEYREQMDDTKLRGGLATAMALSARGNQYLQENSLDNALLASNPERCAEVLLNAVNLIYVLSVVFHPFMPNTSEGILRQLNAPPRSLPTKFSIDILPGHVLGKAEYLFKKIDNVNGEQEKKWQRQYGGDAVVADHVVPPGPGGHPEGGKVPKAKDADAESKKAAHEARRAQLAKEKKAAQAAADAKKTPEEKELEAKVEAQGKRLAAIKKGLEEGDAEKEMSVAKSLKTELAELRKRLKGTTI
ncbi:methionine-tRNA ligase [Cryptococcus neoformans]|nr:methionine-tRNA ligase [Cryptococcus neoformans var. grubii c45]OWZ62849.1 methionine-tRNA ligase [Cryptococcus neoformans var. grubii]OWZ78195.1 methionine-tRNA ligase [Cryptococcus neoformans var. grubii Bt85]OXC61826.1 methionine-tRNA ligase [Cryptococcus neoformans var. grubii MW-RSA852]OXG18724.1 methionine-tRNA ligase [Cryptococcus neoformans var. grubii Tu401-1]OXM79306.1 methionine-tRNA ligase [Cryptococcus neoformans var. grubii Bt63]UOH80746.1 methionine-tRNA ligase [Cryptococcus